MEKRESRMHLPTLDDLFTTQEERDSVNLEKVVDIPLNEIDDFPEHPFKVEIEEKDDIVESIKQKGVLVPAIVRKKTDGRYEMVSGHRRRKASELLELNTLPCIVRDLSDDDATIIMVDSNLQRERILPSEKAFAYKMKLEAIKKQAGRPKKENSRQVVGNLESADILGMNNNESGRQVQRYIRLTNLIPQILDYVDNSIINDKELLSIALSPAVEISFLTPQEQKSLLDYMSFYGITPSYSQAIEMKKLSQNGEFTPEKMESIMAESKPNETPKLKVSMNRLSNVLPKTLRNDREREDYVIKAVEFYDKYQKRLKEKKSQER